MEFGVDVGHLLTPSRDAIIFHTNEGWPKASYITLIYFLNSEKKSINVLGWNTSRDTHICDETAECMQVFQNRIFENIFGRNTFKHWIAKFQYNIKIFS